MSKVLIEKTVQMRGVPFFILLPIFLLMALSGCTSLRGMNNAQREMVLENSWVRSTTSKEFLGYRRMNRMAPIVHDNMVIQGNAIDGLVAYNRKTGSQIWRIDLENGVEGGAQLVGERLYFGSSNGLFYCAGVKDGHVIWSAPVRAETLAPPTIDKGVVYLQSGADVVYALDAESGKQLWIYNRQVTTSLSIRATTRPVVAGDLVLAGFSDGFVVALKKRDGGLSWERKLGKATRFHDVDATPVVDGATVYVASFDAALFSLKLESGEVNWSVNEGAYVPVTLGSGQYSDWLFYATASGRIMILEKATGKQIRVIEVKRGIATQPVQYRNLLVYGESEGSFTLTEIETGTVVSRFFPGEGLVSRPTLLENTGEAYFVSSGANLYALKMGYRRRSEKLPWRMDY